MFQGFSIYTNTIKLFNTQNINPNSLTCINGIRFLSLSWVVIGHIYSAFSPYNHAMVNNLNIFGDEFLLNGAMNVVFNAFPSVDSFFLIGATLLTYLTLKELDRNNGGGFAFWIKFYVHRYIRLTGVYAVIIFFHATLLKFFATGPVSAWVTGQSEECQNDWWKNLLYINNLVLTPVTFGCMGHSWYLGVDMQFFIISPFIIWAIWKSPKIGTVIALVLTLAGFFLFSTSFSFISIYSNNCTFHPCMDQ